MPQSDAAIEKAAKQLEAVELESFRATPSSIVPFGQSELRWSATAPIGVHFKLDNRQVPRIGSQVVRPHETRTFRLTAHSGPLSVFVGQVTVSVDLAACTSFVIEESQVQATLDQVVAAILDAEPQLKQRAAPFVDVTPQGIVLKLRFEVEVACSRNPDFDIDALIGLRIEGTEIVPFFKSFQGSLDYSALEDALNYTIGAFLGFGPQLAIAIGEDNAESQARRAILDGVRAAIEQFLRLAPAGSAPSDLELRDDGVEIRLCPLGGFKRRIRIPPSGLTFTFETASSANGPPATGVTGSRVERARRTTKSNRRRGSR